MPVRHRDAARRMAKWIEFIWMTEGNTMREQSLFSQAWVCSFRRSCPGELVDPSVRRDGCTNAALRA